MPEPTELNELNRRATDQISHIALLLEIKQDVQAIRSELTEFKREVNKAFPKDDEGFPDYDGHRKGHIRDNKEDSRLDDFKIDFAKKLFGWIGIGSLGFIFAAVVNYIKGGNL